MSVRCDPADEPLAPGSIDEALAWARRAGLERLDARVLLAHLLAQPATWLMAHGADALPADIRTAFESCCRERQRGVPVSYLTGRREFHGLTLQISPAVLDPRPDTETLVDWALQRLAASPAGAPTGPRVLDLGTGSGAIALAIKAAHPDAEVCATDRSAAALAVAEGNARRLGLAVGFCAGNWFEALTPQQGRFDVIVSNPPYIAPGDPHLQRLSSEPQEALVAANSGLADLYAIIDGAPRWLSCGGWLLLEHGYDQADAVCLRLATAGFEAVGSRHDLAGHRRCSGGQRMRG